MAMTRLSLRKIRDMVRLHHAAALSNRAIARAINVSASTVSDCLSRPQLPFENRRQLLVASAAGDRT